MDDQDEGSRRIYNQRDLTKKGDGSSEDTWTWSIRGGEEEFILGRDSMTDFYPSLAPLMILLPNDPARPMTKSSLRPSSWARFSTKFIVLSLLGLGSGSLTTTVKDPSNQDPIIYIYPLYNFPHKHFLLYFLIWFNSFGFIAPNCRKFIKFILKNLNLVVWCHTTTLLKGDLNYHLIRGFLDNSNKLYNNSININLSQKAEYIFINLIFLSTTFKKKIISYFLISINHVFFLFFFSLYIYIYIYIYK